MTRHHEEKFLPYSAVQMFDLVAGVARYPEFLPWTAAARIRSRQPVAGGGEVMEADLVISFKLFREKFGSRVTLLPDEGRILTEYLDGPFRHLKSVWSFSQVPGLPQAGIVPAGIVPASFLPAGIVSKSGCKVVFDVEFEFRNAILAGVIGLVFNEAMTRVVRAFEARAKVLFAPR